MSTTAEPVMVQAERLRALAAAIVAAGGSEPDEAQTVADNLVEANLQGHDSHGVGMLPRYIGAIDEGGLVPNAHATVVADAGALVTVTGNQGYGQVVGAEAMRIGITRAQELGSCILALGHAHHIGRIGHWAEMATEAGLVSIHFVNVDARGLVAPWGGREPRFGTNPFCVGVPRPDQEPIILDFATSRVAQGKLRVAFNKGEPIAEGMLLDDRGEPTTDPSFAVKPPLGAMLPFGEHKGYGLALMCELLGGALAAGRPVTGLPHSGQRWFVYNGMLAILIDPARLGHGATFSDQVNDVVSWVTSSTPQADVERVLVAGEPERRTKAERLANGLPIDPGTWAELVKTAEKVGLGEAEVRSAAGLTGG